MLPISPGSRQRTLSLASAAKYGVPEFSFPIEGLTVVQVMEVGPVRVRPAPDVLNDLKGELGGGTSSAWFEQFVAEHRAGAIAQVDAEDRETAVELVVQAVDVLRVFQHMRYGLTEVTQFGVGGDVGPRVVAYAEVGARAGHGYLHRGDAIGWTFSEPSAWDEAASLREVATSIGRATPPEGHRRALIGLQLLSQAIIEPRPTLKMVEVVGALEAWLLPRHTEGQTFRLARAVAFFLCGRPEGNLCGRDRDTCPYLELDPSDAHDRKRLKALRTRGSSPPWRCSEWHQVVDWYDLRSDVVHGRGPTISMKEASSAEFWVYRYLAAPAVKWLADHATDPVGELDRAFAALPPGPDWHARLGPLPGS